MLDYFYDRFGVPAEIFEDFEIFERNKGIWLIRYSRWLAVLERLPVESAGLMILRRLTRGVKPTTIALQLFGKWINKNVVFLTEDELFNLIQKKSVKISSEKSREASRGYVAVMVEEYVVGCAFYKDRQLLSQLPKSFSTVKLDGFSLATPRD
ncbi:MAG: hypothetical protein DRG83_21950 [Deltaproteobacteria bacterium]|nr:MAG: hypothetical protein DRG83_21950 [Deltaproteobacteria bacterium]